MNCPSCNAVNPGHARFCGTCGHALALQAAAAAVPLAKVAAFFKWVGCFFTGLVVLGFLTEF